MLFYGLIRLFIEYMTETEITSCGLQLLPGFILTFVTKILGIQISNMYPPQSNLQCIIIPSSVDSQIVFQSFLQKNSLLGSGLRACPWMERVVLVALMFTLYIKTWVLIVPSSIEKESCYSWYFSLSQFVNMFIAICDVKNK